MLVISPQVSERSAVMPITITTDRSGRHALVSVPDDAHSAIALVEMLPALRWTATDDIVVDLSRFATIDLRVAVVLAQAKRHHDEIGRSLRIACHPDADIQALQTMGLDQPGVLFRSLADTGWLMDGSSPRSSEPAGYRPPPRMTTPGMNRLRRAALIVPGA
jgi:anti-anti-sigma regulatory factor